MLPAIMSPELTPTPISSWAIPLAAHARFNSPSSCTMSIGRRHRVVRMVGIVQRRAEQRHHHVADEFIDRSLVLEHDFDHAREVLIELADQFLGVSLLGHRGESADVGEQNRHLPALAPQLRPVGMCHQLRVDVPRHVSAEQLLDLPLFLVLDEVPVGRPDEKRQRHRRKRLHHVQPRATAESNDRDRRPAGRSKSPATPRPRR